MTSKKFRLATLGCRTNQYESEGYGYQLRQMGYSEAKEGEAAEICIVNTCTVTASADRHSRSQIRQLIKNNPDAKVVVTGCLAESLPKMDGVTHVVPNHKKEELLSELFPEEELPEFKIDQFSGHTRPFVKVQDGCNSFCTYCIIPYVRGRSRSRKMEEILQEIEGLVTQGYQEVVLTGINIGDYEWEGRKLADLVRAVDQIEGLKRIRVSSIDPDEVDGALTDAILNGKKTCPSMHIVLQSGSNVVLKRMNRKYTRQVFLATIERLRELNPDFTFTTDVIVGFPGETDQDFEETLDVMRQVKFAKIHMFPYSDRKRTRASLFPNKVPVEVIQERKQIVLREAERLAFSLRDRFIGQALEVLTEENGVGHTANFLPVLTPGVASNQWVRITPTQNTALGLA
jgi:threonylcarbamoyladenosine tRNA methylthiotransferase MtaB